MTIISYLCIYSYELCMSICKTDKTQRGRSCRHHNIKHGNILANPARKSMKPGLMIRKASDSLG